MGQSFMGNRIILVPKFDPHDVWRLVETEKVTSVMITGDAMGKPLVEALDEPGVSYDLSSLMAITSSAALFSAPVKDEFFEHLPDIMIIDAVGSSESGNNGMATMGKGAHGHEEWTHRHRPRARPSSSTKTSSRSCPARG